MKIAAQFIPQAQANIDPNTLISSGSFNAQLPIGAGKILIFNQSLVDLQFTFVASSYVDVVPAQTWRLFNLRLPTWLIHWQSINAVPNYLLASVMTNQTICTVIGYEDSEEVPEIGTTTSYVNPNSVVIQAGRDVESTGFFTGNSNFTLTSTFNANRPGYLQQIIVSIFPTNSSSNSTHLNIADQIGNTWAAYYIGQNTFGVFTIDFNPAIIYQLGTVELLGTFSNTAGSGNTGGCMVTMVTYGA